MGISESDRLLISQIKSGDADAWHSLVKKYQGRLRALMESRVRDKSTCDDLVQETFVGFMVSLPNYRDGENLEAYLFSIASYKLVDHFRRLGRRHDEQITPNQESETGDWDALPDDLRQVSSLMQSQERRDAEQDWLRRVLGEMLADWQAKGDYERISCLEMIFVKGWPNKKVAGVLKISEQAVAGVKFQALARLRQRAPGK